MAKCYQYFGVGYFEGIYTLYIGLGFKGLFNHCTFDHFLMLGNRGWNFLTRIEIILGK
jgi:hypothetical protein